MDYQGNASKVSRETCGVALGMHLEVEGAEKKVRYKELRVRRVVQTKNGIGHSVRSCAVTCSHAKVITSR